MAGLYDRLWRERSKTTNWRMQPRPPEFWRTAYHGKADQAEFERSLPKIVECLEEPIATSSIVPMYFVSQRARQDVKVALIGQGPDEMFGGYKRHLGVHYGDWWRGLPAGVRSVR